MRIEANLKKHSVPLQAKIRKNDRLNHRFTGKIYDFLKRTTKLSGDRGRFSGIFPKPETQEKFCKKYWTRLHNDATMCL
jgi:hypothetical protein